MLLPSRRRFARVQGSPSPPYLSQVVLLTRVLLLGLFILAVCCAVLIAATGRHQRSFEHPRATTQRPRRAARSAAGRRRGIQSRTSLSGYQIMALSSLLAMPLAGEAAARRRKVAGKQGGRSTSPTEAGGEAARCSTTWRLLSTNLFRRNLSRGYSHMDSISSSAGRCTPPPAQPAPPHLPPSHGAKLRRSHVLCV